MDPFAFIPLVSCVLCTGFCLSVWSGPASLDDRRRRAYTRVLIASFAVYTALQVVTRVGGPGIEIVALRASGLVLIAMGPIAVMTCLQLALHPYVHARKWSNLIYVIAAALAVAELKTWGLFDGLRETAFGLQPIPGPLYLPILGFVLGCGVIAFITLSRALADSPDFDQKANKFDPLMKASVILLLGLAAVTDVILPLLGIDAPELATVGFGLVALSSIWSISQRDGGHLTASPALISEHILHALNEGVAFLDVEGRVLLANESLGHMVGEDSRELFGRTLDAHLPEFDLATAHDRLEFECELHDHSGHSQPVSMSLSTVRDSRGAPLGRVVVLRDVRELKTLKNRLVMSGRLAAVGQMAAGIAHEINNPISFVRTNLGVLREHWQALDAALGGEARDATIEDVLKDGEELIAESVEGVDRAAGIVRDVRELSHAGPAGRVHSNLNQLLERVIRLASPEMGPGISIERRYGEDCRAHVSPDQLTQVFVNLLTNAIHSVDRQGHIVIESQRRDDRIEISVIDDGAGIPESIRERIFDPFYTTKEVGIGTGLGLSISHEIVRGHGGELVYAPNPPGGACFTVYLDASPEGTHTLPG